MYRLGVANNSKIVLAIWLGIILLSLWVVTQNLHITTNISQFMPQAKTDAGRFILQQLQSGAGSRLILMAISDKESGADTQQLAKISQQFSTALREIKLFVEVNNGAAVLDKQTQDMLFRYRYLLSPNISPQYFTQENLREMLTQRYRELASPMAVVSSQRLGQDPGNDFFAVLSRLQSQAPSQNGLQRSIWISETKGMAFVLVKTRADGFALDEQQLLQENITRVFAQLDGAAKYSLQMSGPGVIAVNTRLQIQNNVQWLSIIASVAVIVLLFVVYRSVLVVLVNILPLITAMLVAAACTTLIFHEVHGITFAFGMTIIGVAIDYPIHVFSHLSGSDNVKRDMQRIWPTLRLGVITSCSGYLSLLATDFAGLTQLAVFSIAGLLSAMLFTRWVLPVFLHGRLQQMQSSKVPRMLASLLLSPARWQRITALACAGMIVVYCMMNTDRLWEHDIASLSPISKQAIQLDRQLRDAMGVADFSHLILVEASDLETLLRRCEALEKDMKAMVDADVVHGFDLVSRYLPSEQLQAQRQTALPDAKTLSERMHNALQGTHFKQGLFDGFIVDVEQSRRLPYITQSDFDNSILSTRLESLLAQREGQWLAIVPLFGLTDAAKLQQWLQQRGDQSAHYLNIKSTTNELVAAFRDQALQRMQWAVLFIVAVLWLGLRSVPRLVMVIVPVLASMVFTVGLFLLMGQSLSIFNLVALLLVFGIGVDYSLFFNRDDSQYEYRLQTLHALIVCAISTVSVFGILSLSDIPVLQDIGQTVAIGVIASFFFAMAISQRAISPEVKPQAGNLPGNQ